MVNITLETLHKELKLLRRELYEIKKHMVDTDAILTEDDYMTLQEYKKEKSGGKLILHEELKKELGL